MADESTPASPTSETPPPRTTGGNWRWEPPTAEELQNLMPGYTIEKILGRGGMGAVYRGVQTNLDRPVAIKILPPGVEKEDPSFAERFKSEARLMAKLNHPAVVAVYDFGTTAAGQLYFAMEYVDGSDVSQMIAAQGRLPPEHALAITAHVCDALSAAHELGIVHRDIKPANVLLNMKGQVKVADFGLAKVEDPGQHGLTKTGYAMGTPDFVAPEALMLGTAVDGRADLYAVGVMLYQMLTGNIPRGAFKPASVLVPGLDPRFDPIILKAMQHDRAERHQSAAELRRELDVILTVPFVRNDAPVSAAIPVAQVAQAPGQRSAAQKPVAKGPQQYKGGAETPLRSSTPGGAAAKKPEAGKSARAPLFIGLGAAAALGIGAFVMFSGGKKTPLAAGSGSAPPAKPASVASAAPKPAASTPPKPATTSTPSISKSPPLPISPASDQFPPGQWVKVSGGSEAVSVKRSTIKQEGIWWVPASRDMDLRVVNLKAQNLGLRATFQRSSQSLSIDISGSGTAHRFSFNPAQRSITLSIPHEQKTLSTKQAALNLPEQEFTVEFTCWKGKYLGRINGELVLAQPDSQRSIANVGIYESGMFRDIEVINLDGLSEAEALKILGVDEKGNDLRKPAAVAATAPAPSVSKSPPLPVSLRGSAAPSSEKFPPGQWVKLFTKAEDLPEELRKAGMKFEDGWIRFLDLKPRRIYAANGLTNYGIRAKFLRSIDTTRTSVVMIRARQAPEVAGYLLSPNQSEMYSARRLEGEVSGPDRFWTVSSPAISLPQKGDEYTLEWCCVGDKLIARLGEHFVKVVTDSTYPSGPGFFTGNTDLRDIEVINLDGLPEAEALRILGVDEKGNDLRALVAKQEQQQMEQAKAVDAMAAIPELKALHEQFVKLQAERVTAPFEAEVAKLNAGYVGGIDREIANEKKAGHLDGVIALEAERKLIADKQPIPAEDEATTTDALKKLRGIYRAAYAKIEAARAENLKALTDPLDNRLKQIEAALTQQDRISHAKTVREYREGLGKDGSAVTPDRTSSNGGAAAKMNEAEKSLRAPVAIPKASRSKPDPEKSRQAVEYALSKGCEVSIDRDGVIIPVKKLEDLPKGRWGLHRVKFLTPVTDEDLQAVTRAVELKEFHCNDRVGAGTFTSLAPLGNTPGLKILMLNRADREFSTADAQALLQSAETLEQLNWLKLQSSDSLLPVVTACKNLNYLYLQDTELTDDDMDQLRTLPLLRSISFRGSKLTDAGARHLAKFNQPLSRLLIADPFESGVTPLTPEGLAIILKTHGGTLIQLNIGSHGSSHTDGMLRSIAAECSALETLAIRGEASPEALAGLAKLKKIQQLDLPRTSGKTVPLSVAQCQAISGIKSLETLSVSDCGLTGEHIQALAGLKLLKTLHLNRSAGITDASVPSLLNFQELENLGLVNAGLTPAGILKLTALKKLRTLTITGIDLTAAHLAQFKAALPGCNIVR